ncbi:MAG: serine/threonine protein kinase [Actinomycetota bacterium]|nr:serine/threonine protein kinase [Actinomycetota bacterium]
MNELPADTLQPGTLLSSDYEVIGLVDRGTKHEVYDVWCRQRRCRCIAKSLSGGPSYGDRARRQLLREGRLLARFTHPHLVRAYETIPKPRPIVILETLTGETLSHAIDRLGRLSIADVVLLGQQLCSVSAYLHEHGWLHLDFKPSNIVCESAMAKVLDLSIARGPGRARPGIGTDGYMSPEQIEGGLLSASSDVWGIGMVLFEAATGSLPLEDPDAEESESPEDNSDDSYAAEPPVPIVEPLPSLASRRRTPRALAEAVDQCLALAPCDRPTLEELSEVLALVTGVDPRRAGMAEL